MYALETQVSASGKSKYFGTLIAGNFVKAGSKKAALLFIDELNKNLLIGNNSNVTDSSSTQGNETISTNSEECQQGDASYGSSLSVRRIDRCSETSQLSNTGGKHSKSVQDQLRRKQTIRRLVDSSEQLLLRAEQHKREAEQHRKDAESVEQYRLSIVPLLFQANRPYGECQQDQIHEQQPRQKTIYQSP